MLQSDMKEIEDAYTLIQTIVDTQENLVVLIEDEKPILINKAFKKFFDVRSLEQYNEECDAFINSFVPHPSYFHAGKVEAEQTWIEALNALDEKDKIVSILSTSHEPRAFQVTLDNTHPRYTVLSLEDISANLIKCIMIENDMTMDKGTGAYSKEYFLHTAEILQDGASYNEKEIGLSLMSIPDSSEEGVSKIVTKIKSVIRQNDMLIKYSSGRLLLAYLIDLEENAVLFSKKIHSLITGSNASTVVSLVKQDEKIAQALRRIESALDVLNENEIKVL